MSYRVSEHVHARPMHDEVMILDTRTNQYLGLNGSGAVVWSILADGGSASDAVAELMMQFDVTREIAEADVTALLDQLLRLDLITPATS